MLFHSSKLDMVQSCWCVTQKKVNKTPWASVFNKVAVKKKQILR